MHAFINTYQGEYKYNKNSFQKAAGQLDSLEFGGLTEGVGNILDKLKPSTV